MYTSFLAVNGNAILAAAGLIVFVAVLLYLLRRPAGRHRLMERCWKEAVEFWDGTHNEDLSALKAEGTHG